MDPANHQLIQDILNSDRFIDWALQKTIQEMVIFPSEEYAVCAYVSELAHCSPLQAFPQSSVHGVSGLPSPMNPSSVLSTPPSLPLSESTVPSPAVSVTGTSFERWQAILEAPWKLAHQQEPMNDNRGSILKEWLQDISPSDSKEQKWKCQAPSSVDITQPCGKILSRWDRGITHIRSNHLDLRPFRCGGGGDCKAPDCEKRFTSKENLRQHQYLKSSSCQWCYKEVLQQNLKRHQDRCRARPSAS